MWRLTVVACVFVLAACSGSPTDPSDGGGPGNGGGGGGGTALTCPQFLGTAARAQGTMSGSINGVAWTADCIAVLANSATIFSLGAADLATGVNFQTLGFGGNKVVGTQTITALSPLNASLTQGSNGWTASLAQGSGTLVMTTVSNNAAAGTFTFSMPPVPGNPATGTKTVTGSCNLTF
jgi:hypothetical protein